MHRVFQNAYATLHHWYLGMCWRTSQLHCQRRQCSPCSAMQLSRYHWLAAGCQRRRSGLYARTLQLHFHLWQSAAGRQFNWLEISLGNMTKAVIRDTDAMQLRFPRRGVDTICDAGCQPACLRMINQRSSWSCFQKKKGRYAYIVCQNEVNEIFTSACWENEE
jgi:hypothetical protein